MARRSTWTSLTRCACTRGCSTGWLSRRRSRRERRGGREAEEKADPDGARASCTGAWLSPRWVGHEVGREEDISALLWMVRDVRQAARPPRDVDYSARVKCRALGLAAEVVRTAHAAP